MIVWTHTVPLWFPGTRTGSVIPIKEKNAELEQQLTRSRHFI